MPYEILPHTADVRLKASGKTPEELFSEALKGMMTIAKPAVKNSTESARRQCSAKISKPLLITELK